MPMYVVELRNKTTLWVNEEQAKVIDEAWVARMPVKIQGSKISTVDIVGIWPAETWYENHPEDRPKPDPYLALPAVSPVAKQEDTPHRKLWWEVLKRNGELIKKGLKPKWVVENNQLVEKEDFWKQGIVGQRPCKNHFHPIRLDNNQGMDYAWVKKTVSDRAFTKQFSGPGYYRLPDEFDKKVVGFRVAGTVSAHLDTCNPTEQALLEQRLAHDTNSKIETPPAEGEGLTELV